MWVADLADPSAVDELAVAAMTELGGVDMLINNAGIPKRRHVTALDAATIDALMNINYSSPVRLTLALLPQMLERGEGRIVNVSSVAATLSPPGEAAYAATKAAITVFSECMAVDLWDTGVKVTVIYPGVVDTELFTLPDNDPFVAQVESITVDEAVATILAGVAADAAQVYVPAWFGDIASSKAANVEQFLAGTAEYIRQQGTNT
jgi:short-subunit dehydrogenase